MMEYLFTEAVQRALAEAVTWSSSPTSPELEAPALLLGLLAESECRAAIVLDTHGVTPERVLERWPRLARHPKRYPAWDPKECPENAHSEGIGVTLFAGDIHASLAEVCHRMSGYQWPLVLATEHLLLGLASAEHEVSAWLGDLGVDADEIEEAIRQWHGPESVVKDWPSLTRKPGGMLSTPASPGPAHAISPEQGGPRPGPACHDRMATLRAIDAAANRAQEGLRVVEDYVRFALDDRHLTGHLKQLRHELAQVLKSYPLADRLAARETQADVGTVLSSPTEAYRRDAAGVLSANFIRLQEGLRSLEEFGKVLDEAAAARLKQLRYRAYTLHRAVQITTSSLNRLRHARLYVLLDGGPSTDGFAAVARALVEAGVHAIQLRDKQLEDRVLLERARALHAVLRPAGVLFLMNDRPDLAVLASADGVHVGQEELAVKDVRAIVGPKALIGVSTHSIEQARQAVLDGADYLGVGPTFPSGTKQFDAFPGPELLRAVAAEIRLPAFAIGGITADNLPQVLEAGMGRIAVGQAVTHAADPAAAARALLARLPGPWPAPPAE